MTHVVLVDRQKETQELVGRYLTGHGYHVSAAADPAGLRSLLDQHPPDLIVLDMQTIQGKESAWPRLGPATARDQPLIVLTSGEADVRRAGGLALAADDYLAKPLAPTELLERIERALNRRRDKSARSPLRNRTRRFDRWTLTGSQRRLRATDGSEVKLSPGELKLLKAFLDKPGEIMTREQLLELTIGRDADVFDRCIDSQIKRLRKKIEIDPARPAIIRTYWRRGYRFAAEVWCGLQDPLSVIRAGPGPPLFFRND